MDSPRKPNASAGSPSLARAGVLSLGGAAFSSVLGFAVNIVIARAIGDTGYGIVIQTIAVFSIALSLGKVGMDSAAIWVCARAVSIERQHLRAAVRFMLLAALGGCSLAALAVTVAGFAISGGEQVGLGPALIASAWAIPAAGVLLVVLSTSRGLGAIRPYVLLGSVALPSLRLLFAVGVGLLGWSAVGQSFAWAAPNVVIVMVALWVLRGQVRRARFDPEVVREHGEAPADRRAITRYASGRTLSAGLEQGLLYLDVLLVGVLAGSAAAGVYGGATRFVAAGLIADVAIRVVVAPQFSLLLHRGELRQLESLYRKAAVWLVLLSAPIYVTLATFARTVLRWLGDGFLDGASVLVILSFGTAITLAAGNIHSVLLMSGRSGLVALNKAAVLTLNVVGNLVLVPMIGINGAAIAWTAAMLLDAAMASFEVRRYIGVRLQTLAVLYPLFIAAVTFGVPGLLVRFYLGESNLDLLLSLALSAPIFVGWCIASRRTLGLEGVREVIRRRSPPVDAASR